MILDNFLRHVERNVSLRLQGNMCKIIEKNGHKGHTHNLILHRLKIFTSKIRLNQFMFLF